MRNKQTIQTQISKNDLYWIFILIVGATVVALMGLLIILKFYGIF